MFSSSKGVFPLSQVQAVKEADPLKGKPVASCLSRWREGKSSWPLCLRTSSSLQS